MPFTYESWLGGLVRVCGICRTVGWQGGKSCKGLNRCPWPTGPLAHFLTHPSTKLDSHLWDLGSLGFGIASFMSPLTSYLTPCWQTAVRPLPGPFPGPLAHFLAHFLTHSTKLDSHLWDLGSLGFGITSFIPLFIAFGRSQFGSLALEMCPGPFPDPFPGPIV